MNELTGSCYEAVQEWVPVQATACVWSELERRAALAAPARWVATPAMEEMSLYD